MMQPKNTFGYSRKKRARRRNFYILIVFLILLFGLVYGKNVLNHKAHQESVVQDSQTKTVNQEIFSSFIDRVNELEQKTQEYGENRSITLNSGNLLTYIVYPVGDNETLNSQIKEWIDNKLYYYLEDSREAVSELSIYSSSHIVGDRFISVVLNGSYDNSSYAHPEDIVKTFTIDLKSNKIVKLDKIFNEDAINKISSKVISEANIESSVVDRNLLDNFAFTTDGLVIPLKRGLYTAMSDGNVNVVLSEKFFRENAIKYFGSVQPKASTAKNDSKVVADNLDNNVEVDAKQIAGKKLIALTFDDGPSIYTNKLLDILSSNNVKATFFILGCQINKYPNELIRIARDGHQIGSHTWDHKQLTKLSEKDIEDEFMTTRTKIFNTAKVDTLAIRAPYGSVNDKVKAIAKKFNMYFVHWSIDTLDWKTKNADTTYKTIVEKAGDGQIVLCHDIHKPTVDAMDRVIKKLKADGYQFVTVSQLFKIKGIIPKSGAVYYNAK